MLNKLKVIAFTHKNLALDVLGTLHLSDSEEKEALEKLKNAIKAEELMYLSTCNRVEFIYSGEDFEIESLLNAFKIRNNNIDVEKLKSKAECYEGEAALNHLFKVASSLDSLVVGEREIITQVRKAYEKCKDFLLTGDLIRIVIKQTIETAKTIYTETRIAQNPVSVVSLAYRQLRDMNVLNNARFVFVGAGETNRNFAQYLKKHQYANFTVFNRGKERGESLAKELGGQYFPLESIKEFKGGFDVLVCCTGANEAVIREAEYTSLLNGEFSKKIVVDLAIPSDLAAGVFENYSIYRIDVASLNERARKNLEERSREVERCEAIIEQSVATCKALYRERMIELMFGEIPKRVKEIRELAVNEVFANEVNSLDNASREIVEKMLVYMEKKYNAVTMTVAKKVFLESENPS